MGCHNNQVYRYSGTCNHPFIMIIIMIMSLAGVAVSRAALRPGRSASMPTSEGGELLVCLASIAFSNTEGEERERGGRDSDIEIHNNSFDIDLAECGYTLEPRTSQPSLATYLCIFTLPNMLTTVGLLLAFHIACF